MRVMRTGGSDKGQTKDDDDDDDDDDLVWR